MINSFNHAVKFLVLIVSVAVLAGCSGGSNPTTPGSDQNNSTEKYQTTMGGVFAGEYSLSLDSETVSGELIPGSRNVSLDATKQVKLTIDGLHWDPADRKWDIVLLLQNTSAYDVYRPWLVFTELSGQELLNRNHFVWVSSGPFQEPIRVPQKELDKASPKLFERFSTERMHLVIHWPEGVSSFSPIQFFIDVAYPSFRNQPDIISIDVTRESSLSRGLTVVGNVLDLQSPPQGLDRMDAWVDFSAVGGPNKVHLDGIESSDTGVCVADVDFHASGVCTLHAVDWQGYGIEQDFSLSSSIEPCPQTREAGSGLATGRRLHKPLLLTSQASVDQLWLDLEQVGPPPQMEPDEMFAFLCPGPVSKLRESPTRPTLSLTCAYLDPDDDGDQIPDLVIEWSFADGGDEDCDGTADDFVTPFAFFGLPAVQVPSTRFEMERVPSSCPDGSCLPVRDLASGDLSRKWSDGHVTLMKIQEEVDLFWRVMGATGEPPTLGQNEACVAVIGDEMPSAGSEIVVTCVAPSSGGGGGGSVHVEYSLRTPDSSCPSEPGPVTPFSIVAFAADNPLYKDVSSLSSNPLYRCAADGCEPALDLASGDSSGIRSPYFDVVCSSLAWSAFWSLHQPGTVAPPVDFSSKSVVVVCLGDRPTTGFAVELDCVSLDDATGLRVLDVAYTENIPDPATCQVDPVVTQPFAFYVTNSLAFDDWDLKSNPKIYSCD